MIRVAVIGAGYFARFQIGAWARMEGVELVAIVEPDAERRAAAGTLAPGAALLADMEALSGPCDVIDIATPPATHAKLVKQAAGRAQTVICQKPFCTTLEEAKATTAFARDAGITLAIHENFRFQPWYRRIRAEIDAGTLGEIVQARFALRPGDGQGAAAYLDRQPYFRTMTRFLIRETGIHFIDTFRYLFGPPTAVYADLWQGNPVIAGEDSGLVILDIPGGGRAVFDGNRRLDHAAANHRLTMGEFSVEGSAGEIRLTGDGALWFRARASLQAQRMDFTFEDIDFGGNCVAAFQCHIRDALSGRGTFETRADDYLHNLELEEMVYHSAQKGAKVPLT